MKELTIEQKDELYDEALRKAKEALDSLGDNYICNHLTKDDIRDMYANFFPELRESEDEKIRKELIFYFQEEIPRCSIQEHADKMKEFIAWLKKQNSPAKLSEEEQNRFAKGVLASCALSFIDYLDAHKFEDKMCVSNMECEDIENSFHNAMWDRLHRYYCKYIEKQGEHKSYAFEIMNEKGDFDNGFTKMMEKEQKPTDKVKPKFKVGDWVVVDDGRTGRIIECTTDFADIDLEFSCLSTRVNNIRSYTIQDAKDGDVVADKSDGAIGIFQSIGHHPDGGSYNDPSYCLLHCRCDDEFFYADFEHGNTIDSDDLIPATKEQRNLLFQKMKEAGYEWDAEKKELKKIKNKKPLLSDFFKAEYERGKADAQKPTEWEPQTGDTFRKKGTTSPTYHLCNKREDGITFGFVENREVGIAGGEITIFALKDDYELVERPKSMENIVEEELNRALQTKVEQTPAWSEEDESMRTRCIGALMKCYMGELPQTVIDEVEWLKSLRPQNRWKPSDKHYELEEFTKIVRGNLTGISKAVQELFEAKYLQLTGNKMYGGFKD